MLKALYDWPYRICCSSVPKDEGEYIGNVGDVLIEKESPSVIIPPSSLACVGFVSNRKDASQSYKKKFANRIVKLTQNRHGKDVNKATNTELITFDELLRK